VKVLKGTSLSQARAAKVKAVRLFGKHPLVNGVGLARVADGYALKVNFLKSPDQGKTLPKEIDGVPILIDVVGPIAKRKASNEASMEMRRAKYRAPAH
jgi:hypothetical protein